MFCRVHMPPRTCLTRGSRLLWLFWLPCLLLLLLAGGTPAAAQTWVKIRGTIVYDSDNGQISIRHFSRWLSNKQNRVPSLNRYDPRLVGNFSFTDDDSQTVIRVTDVQRLDLQGDKHPVVLTFPDRRQREVVVNNSLIWAIARMHEFVFEAEDPQLGRTVVFTVPSESVRSLFFYE